ncbi:MULTISPECIES: PAS domain-containing sensor histidine kinase [unclassified Caulobacter]|uniref:cell cycle histidine kinase PleC n=1 Tax=unclassified Caulobacter TaxID=2648921 RepID=UPI000701D8B3|nr:MULTISPECIES: PAS domain-containing sensor histidine kinase [unclassified Caulobacter]KQV58369.1 ATPase [Caulobacter sp. Root342]KQV69123.1 ATPase [Caulobacter sp. Root343]
MARHGGPARAGPTAPAAMRAKTVQGPSQAFVRVAILAALLLLAVYTAFGVKRLQNEAAVQPGGAPLSAKAGLIAGRVEVNLAAQRAGLSAAADLLKRDPGATMDAAETALRAAGGEAAAVAVVGPSGVVSIAGRDEGADWKAAAQAAAASGRTTWTGSVGDTGRLYVATTATLDHARAFVIASGDATRLIEDPQKGDSAALALPSGKLIAARGRGAQGANTVREAFALSPEDVGDGAVALRGQAIDGAALDVAVRPAAEGALQVLAAAPTHTVANLDRQVMDGAFNLLAPLAVGIALALLLLIQSRKAEVAHREFVDSEQRFRLAVEAARCGIWEWDLNGDQVFLSDVTGAMFGWGGGGVVSGQDLLERISIDHRERVRQALANAAMYGAFDVSFRVPAAEQGGRSLWIDARGQGFGKPGVDGYVRIIGVALDVTEERIAQARAQAAENRLRDAIESVSEAFVLWDRQGRLLMCNRNYRSVFSLEPKLLKPGAARAEVNRFAALAIKQDHPAPDGAKGVREAELMDGRWIQISERRTAEGGLVMTAADITAIKTQEEARRLNEEQLQNAIAGLERSQEQLAELARKYETEKVRAESANKAKSEFLANMSHELRTPLNAINGFSEIMMNEMFGALGDARYKGYSQDIHSSGQHLLALINDILDMSKIEAGKMNLKFEPMHLEDVAEDAVRLIRNRAEAAGLKLSIDFPVLPEIEADYRAVKQVLLNLLSNAIKFTPRAGSVTVRAEVRRDPFNDTVKVSVTDTGIGIAKEDLERLARPFEQVESQFSKTTQGTGLGLALTKSLITMHDGVLEMHSMPGEGTTVSFTLPVRQSDHKATRDFAAA